MKLISDTPRAEFSLTEHGFLRGVGWSMFEIPWHELEIIPATLNVLGIWKIHLNMIK